MWRKNGPWLPNLGLPLNFYIGKSLSLPIPVSFLPFSQNLSHSVSAHLRRNEGIVSYSAKTKIPRTLGSPLMDLGGWLMSMGEVEGERGKEIHSIYSLCSSFQDWRNINVTSIFTIQNLDMNRRSRWNIRALNCIWWCMSIILPHWGRKMDNLRTSWSR